MDHTDLLLDALDRIRQHVHSVVSDLSLDELHARPQLDANSIAWLVWHLTRVQDAHVSELAGEPQRWTETWADRFALPLDSADTGYGHSADDVASVQVGSADLLTRYYDDVHERTAAFVSALSTTDLSRVVDRSWDPPVTCAVRLVSVIDDDIQHAGQAAYVRGLVRRP